MSSTDRAIGEDRDQSESPAQEDVLEELKVLREREGLSAVKLKEKTPLILGLPLVDDQLDFGRFNPRDRHLAAYSVFGCVLDNIDNFRWRTILILTLRYDFNFLKTKIDPSWKVVREQSSLTRRNDIIMTVVRLEKSQYNEQFTRAYEELANQLLLHRRSPCRADRPVGGFSRATLEYETLATLLGLLSVEKQQWAREILTAEALVRLQRGTGSAGRANVKNVEKEFLHRLDRALRGGYKAEWQRRSAPQNGQPRTGLERADRILEPETLRRFILPPADRDPATHPMDIFESRPVVVKIGGSDEQVFARSLDFLAIVMQSSSVTKVALADLAEPSVSELPEIASDSAD